MCNLCSGRLFLVPNPCCCCELRCGVMWAGFSDIVIGLMSLYMPLTIGVKDRKDLTLGGGQEVDDGAPVFDVSVPFLERNNFITHCCLIQIVSGIMIISASYGMGSHIFSRFLLGCTWMLLRLIVLVFQFTLIKYLFKADHGPLMRYGYFVSVHAAVDIYLFVIVRYFTMECYDSYRYKNIMKSLQNRREAPSSSKAAPKTRSGIGEQKKKAKRKKTSQGETDKNVEKVREIFQKRKDLETGTERVPVWDRKNEVIFYGEDYTDWDPSVFQAKWEILNEKEKEEKITKSSKRNLAGMTLEHFAKTRQSHAHDPIDGKNSGSTVTAPDHFNTKANRSHSINFGTTAPDSGDLGRKSVKSQSVNNVTQNPPKPNAEGGQEVDKKFHWSRIRQQYQPPQPFHPVIQRPPRKGTRTHSSIGSVLHKLRSKETDEKDN